MSLPYSGLGSCMSPIPAEDISQPFPLNGHSRNLLLTSWTLQRIAAVNIGRIVQTLVTDQQDFTYVLVDASILVVAEIAIGLIVVCAPTLGPLFTSNPKRSNSSSDQPALQREPYIGLRDQPPDGSIHGTSAFISNDPKRFSANVATRDFDFEMAT